MGFADSANKVKQAIDAAMTNYDIRRILLPIRTAAVGTSNRVLTWSDELNMHLNPFHMLKDIWSPDDDRRETAWTQIDAAITTFTRYIDKIPNDSSPFKLDKKETKDSCLALMAAVETIGTFETVDKNLWPEALEGFLNDCTSAPGLFLQYTGKAVELASDHIIAPLVKKTSKGLWQMLWSIVRSLWWVVAAIAAGVATYYGGMYLLAKGTIHAAQ